MRFLARRYLRRKIPAQRIVTLPDAQPKELLEALFEKIACTECTIVGMGNEKGPGRCLALFCREEAR
jgi:hypothetical protein